MKKNKLRYDLWEKEAFKICVENNCISPNLIAIKLKITGEMASFITKMWFEDIREKRQYE